MNAFSATPTTENECVGSHEALALVEETRGGAWRQHTFALGAARTAPERVKSNDNVTEQAIFTVVPAIENVTRPIERGDHGARVETPSSGLGTGTRGSGHWVLSSRALKAHGYLYFTVELADENETEKAYRAGQQQGLPVVYGEWAHEAGYHNYPAIDQVKEWIEQAQFSLIEEGEGDDYYHCVVRKES